MKINPNLYNGIGGCYHLTATGEIVPDGAPEPVAVVDAAVAEDDLQASDKTGGK